MLNKKRCLCLALGGVTALSLLAPAVVRAEEPTMEATLEVREQLLYNLTYYWLDREGKEQTLSSVRLTLEEDLKAVPVSVLEQHLPAGWVLAEPGDFPIPEGAVDLKIQVKKTPREIEIHYVTADGQTAGKETLVLDGDREKVVATDLRQIPQGHVLVNHVDSPIGADTKVIEILVEKEKRELKVHYVTADGELVHTELLVIPADKTSVVATELREIPKGYHLVNPVDHKLDASTVSIDVLVQKEEPVPTEKVISVHYTTAEGKKILTVSMTVAVDARTVEASQLKGIPNGYRLVSKGSLTIDSDNSLRAIVEAEKKDEEKDEVPKTGDPTAFLAAGAALSLGAGVTLAGIGRKRP